MGYSPWGRKELDTTERVTCTQVPERLWGVLGREEVKTRPGGRLKRQSPDRGCEPNEARSSERRLGIVPLALPCPSLQEAGFR